MAGLGKGMGNGVVSYRGDSCVSFAFCLFAFVTRALIGALCVRLWKFLKGLGSSGAMIWGLNGLLVAARNWYVHIYMCQCILVRGKTLRSRWTRRWHGDRARSRRGSSNVIYNSEG